jgi:2-polyprenyl-3-methyl-5-hydroxy-6-metoxy-1,4-benzoquinol methylase
MDTGAYWRERGKVYRQEWRRTPAFRLQEQILFDYLAPLAFTTVLEIGCGFGRIGSVLTRKRPYLEYTGLDISPDALTLARQAIPGGTFLNVPVQEAPLHRYDLVLSVEVLMHVPPDEVQAVAVRMLEMAHRHLVVVEWADAIDGLPSAHNWRHDYRRLFPGARRVPIGLQALFHVTR